MAIDHQVSRNRGEDTLGKLLERYRSADRRGVAVLAVGRLIRTLRTTGRTPATGPGGSAGAADLPRLRNGSDRGRREPWQKTGGPEPARGVFRAAAPLPFWVVLRIE